MLCASYGALILGWAYEFAHFCSTQTRHTWALIDTSGDDDDDDTLLLLLASYRVRMNMQGGIAIMQDSILWFKLEYGPLSDCNMGLHIVVEMLWRLCLRKHPRAGLSAKMHR